MLKYRGDSALLSEFEQWNVPRFPLSGHILREKGVPGEWHEMTILVCMFSLKLIHAFEVLKIQSVKSDPKMSTSYTVFILKLLSCGKRNEGKEMASEKTSEFST